MHTPLRILRAQAEDLRSEPVFPSTRDQAQREDILTRGRGLLARNARQLLTFSGLAMALKISTGTLRRHFADIEALTGEILRAHLCQIAQALGEVPMDAPDRQYHLCAAYYAATREAFGAYTETHLIFTRDRRWLPPDVLDPIDDFRQSLAETMGGDPFTGTLILDMLDMPLMQRACIPQMLVFVAATRTPAAETPAPLPAKPVTNHRFGPAITPEIAAHLESDDVLTWLHPKGLGAKGACFEALPTEPWPPGGSNTVHGVSRK